VAGIVGGAWESTPPWNREVRGWETRRDLPLGTGRSFINRGGIHHSVLFKEALRPGSIGKIRLDFGV